MKCISAVVFLGGTIGLAIKLLPNSELQKVESFSPTTFFLVLLPPIIFESGYNLHKGEAFQLSRSELRVSQRERMGFFEPTISQSRGLCYKTHYYVFTDK